MPTLNEIVYDIRLTVQPQINDDTNISNRQIEFIINTQRSLFIRNELNRNRSIDPDILQTVCDDLEIVSDTECCELVGNDCHLVRSKNKIPSTIELHNNNLITSIGPARNMSERWNFTTLNQARYAGNGRFNRNLIFAFLHNGYVYITSNSKKIAMIDKVAISGVFENPLEVEKFNNCDGSPCYDKNKNGYPVKLWMVPRIKEQAVNQLLVSIKTPVDTDNDANPKADEVTGG